MLGIDMSWAAFDVLTVMSAKELRLKRIGYLAAAQSFTQHSSVASVIMMATSLFQKDLKSMNPLVICLALDTLSNIATPSLAQATVNTVLSLLDNSYPIVRKKAVATLYKLLVAHPTSLVDSYPKLKSKLSDSHPSIYS